MHTAYLGTEGEQQYTASFRLDTAQQLLQHLQRVLPVEIKMCLTRTITRLGQHCPYNLYSVVAQQEYACQSEL